ncbi:hypothetical protein F4775DRAFT_561557 [Biscogniauxia sp. FL1348]|nr:hypothetical protein F4775DRAFT_561557 [Biscogniauxia sp. FL1348]
MHFLFFALGWFIVETTAECIVNNDCLRAVQNASPSLRTEDCKSFTVIAIAPDSSSTIVSTAVSTTTTVTSRTTTGTIAASPEALRRWLQQHEVINIMMGRAMDSTIQTSTPVASRGASVPEYATACASSAAYASACSCLGITPITITETNTGSSQVIQATTAATSTDVLNTHPIANQNNDSAIFLNSTSPRLDNVTSRNINETTSGREKYKLKTPGVAKQETSAEEGISLVTTSGPGVAMGIGSMVGYSNITSATTTRASANSIYAAKKKPANSTAAAPFASILSTSPSSSSPALNATHAPFANITVTTTNTTANLKTPFLNPTHISNTNTTATAPSLDLSCDASTTNTNTTTPFAVQVAQPGGPFDGWYLRLSGDAVIFTSSAGSRFSLVGGAGHLCAGARMAIAQSGTGGSGVWFVEPEVLEVVERTGYAALRCSGAGGDGLECEEGGWVGCGLGLGLDIVRDAGAGGDGGAVVVVVVDGWNCTGVALSMVYL